MSDLLPKRGPGRPPNNPAAAPERNPEFNGPVPRGYITRTNYRAKYGADDYAAVPESSWGLCEFPDTMAPREYLRIRGKRGV